MLSTESYAVNLVRFADAGQDEVGSGRGAHNWEPKNYLP
jgi:hypothetical protein